MIAINEIQSEYVYQPHSSTILRAEELQSKWEAMSYDERIGWYEVKIDRKKLDVIDLLGDALDNLENNDGYEDMAQCCMDSISNEELAELQELLDKICDNSAFDVYHPISEISPE